MLQNRYISFFVYIDRWKPRRGLLGYQGPSRAFTARPWAGHGSWTRFHTTNMSTRWHVHGLSWTPRGISFLHAPKYKRSSHPFVLAAMVLWGKPTRYCLAGSTITAAIGLHSTQHSAENPANLLKVRTSLSSHCCWPLGA